MRDEGARFHPDTGRPQAMAAMCATCVFRPGNRMRLHRGRVAELVAHNNRAQGAVLTCHQTLRYGQHPELGRSACRGFVDAYPDTTSVLLAEALGGWHPIDPPPPHTEETP